MTVRNLDALFNPKSIAVIGASLRAGSIGEMVWSRLSAANFAGPVWAVNPKHRQLNGAAVFAGIDDLPDTPTVAVLCTPPPTWPKIVSQLGERGTRAVVIIGQAGEPEGKDWTHRTLAAARPFLLRVIGPASVGVMTPAVGAVLGAPSCAIAAGGVAWVSASNALTNGVMGWANARGLGFRE
jgi:acetyltransferase